MSGLLLSTALPGCAHRIVEVPVEKQVPVAVPVKDPAPAELIRCADRPQGLPESKDMLAQIPSPVRAAIIRIARAFAANAAQLDRLINWEAPGTCPGGKAAAK